MKRAFGLLPVLVAAFTIAAYAAGKEAAGRPENGKIEATVRQLDDKLRAASLKGDEATIQGLLADDYVSLSAVTGTPATKADALNYFKSGRLKYDSIDVSEVTVHVYGPTIALIIGKAVAKGKLGDRDLSGSYRYSRLFLKRGGKWQVAAFQSTSIP